MKIFKNRTEAGQELATLLDDQKGTDAIVLAIPRGGIIVGKEVARALGLPLDIIVTRKIGAPRNEEYAIGAIDMDGEGIFNEQEKARVNPQWLVEKILAEKKEAVRRWNAYRKGRGPLDLRGKTAIIVDDGIATGLTVKAAVQYAKKSGAQKVVIASPVASHETVQELSKDAETKIIATPSLFFAVGQFYQNFPQVSDEEVIAILTTENRHRTGYYTYIRAD